MATLQPEVTVGINRELQGCSVVVTPAVWRQLGDVHSNDNIRLTGFLKGPIAFYGGFFFVFFVLTFHSPGSLYP
jgi:hypothetical protein